jgi:hypothetical protein
LSIIHKKDGNSRIVQHSFEAPSSVIQRASVPQSGHLIHQYPSTLLSWFINEALYTEQRQS